MLYVLNTLPKEVQHDFLSDPRFTVSLDNYVPGDGSKVFIAAPGGTGESSRSVVLKPRLDESGVLRGGPAVFSGLPATGLFLLRF